MEYNIPIDMTKNNESNFELAASSGDPSSLPAFKNTTQIVPKKGSMMAANQNAFFEEYK